MMLKVSRNNDAIWCSCSRQRELGVADQYWQTIWSKWRCQTGSTYSSGCEQDRGAIPAATRFRGHPDKKNIDRQRNTHARYRT